MKEEAKMMDCVRFKEIYHEVDRPGTAGFRFRERALLHAEGCPECGALLTDGEALDFGLRNLAVQSAGWEAPARMEAALLREFQKQKLAGERGKIRRQLAILAAAAAVVLAFVLGVHQRIGPGTGSTSQQAGNIAAGARTSAVTKSNEPAAIASDSGDNEYAEEFVALPYADDPEALEGGAIVRVTLPRSELATFGLPIAESEGTDRVAADLVVSQDGTPQAIRLVSQENPNSNF